MSLRSYRLGVALLVALSSACGETGNGASSPNEPQTAREKQLREAKASGEVDAGNTKWGKWRYTGDRRECYFVVGKRCFKTEASACSAARCKASQKCKAVGGGPATVSCK